MNEWRRRPLRSALTVTGVALAIGALFSLLAFERGYRRSLQRELDRLGAHVLIVPKGCPYDAASLALHGANWPCYLKSRYLADVQAVTGVATAVPVLMNALRDANGRPIVYLGTTSGMLALRPHWRISGRFPERDGECMAGSELANRYGWKPGDRTKLPGLDRAHGVITGILEPTASADDYFLHLPLSDAQHWFRHEQELTHVLVRLKDPTRLEEVVGRLRSCDAGMNLNVVPLAHLFRSLQHIANSTRWMLACVMLVAFLIAGAGVTNTLLMAVAERFRELGIFRALGASPVDIFRLVQLESLAVCVAGCALGISAALLAAGALESWLLKRVPLMPSEGLYFWDWTVAASCVLVAFLLGLLVACLPAWRACQIPPCAAMRGIA